MNPGTARSLCVAVLTCLGVLLAYEGLARIAVSRKPPPTFANWAVERFDHLGPLPPTPPRTRPYRVIYLSNSHALTGGRVANHLQHLLDILLPGTFEIVDLSSPGMFAPEFYLRSLAVETCDVNLAILQPAYISFSDRMTLRRQMHTARNFFHPAVRRRLDPRFLLRHWDVQLQTSALLTQFSTGFAEREYARSLWTQPLVAALRSLHPEIRIHTLEIDVNRAWRFPEGFDPNLFNWRLYDGPRKKQLRDWHTMTQRLQENGVKTLVANLPIAFGLGNSPVNLTDYSQFRQELAASSVDTAPFFDYQSWWPTEWTAYDPLHPHALGARAFAFDAALRLRQEIPETFAGVTDDDFLRALRTLNREWQAEWSRSEHLVVDGWLPSAADPTDSLSWGPLLHQLNAEGLNQHRHVRDGLLRLSEALHQMEKSINDPEWSCPDFLAFRELRELALRETRRILQLHIASVNNGIRTRLENGRLRQTVLDRYEVSRTRQAEPLPEKVLINQVPMYLRHWEARPGEHAVTTYAWTEAGPPFQIRVAQPDGNVIFATDILLDGSYLHVWSHPRDLPNYMPVRFRRFALRRPEARQGSVELQSTKHSEIPP